MLITQYDHTYDVIPKKTKYQYNGNLAIVLWCKDGELYGKLTTNLDGKLPPDMAYVDTNNMPDAERFIKENDLGEDTGLIAKSGYCTYPLYRFHIDKMEEIR